MNHRGKKVVFKGGLTLSAWLLVLFFFVGCAGNQQPVETGKETSPDTLLRVGISSNSPPLIFKDNKVITGLEADLARQLAHHLGRKLEFIEVPWEKQLDYLEQGKTDIVMSGMSITKARNYRADFSTPYLRSGQIMLVRMADYQRFSNGITSVMNTSYRIGTVAHTTGDLLVSSTLNKVDIKSFENSDAAVKALADKEIDVFIYDAPMVCYYASHYQTEKLVPVLKMATEEYIGWAMRKGDADLQNSVNEFIKMVINDGSLKRLRHKWIPYLDR